MTNLEIRAALGKAKPELVKLARRLSDAAQAREIDLPQRKGPYQGLRTLARSTTCLAEIENWLRYQASRSGAPEWRPNGVEALIECMRDVATSAERLGTEGQAQAVRLFIGYLLRARVGNDHE